MNTTRKTATKMAVGLALGVALALPAYAQDLPGTLDGNFAILNEGTVTFSGDSVIGSGGVMIGVGQVEVLVVGGGGGGGSLTSFTNAGGGGGGAGGLVLTNHSISGQVSVTVGDGATAVGGTTQGNSGQNSVFGSLVALGGGGGSGGNVTGTAGGSGGGSRAGVTNFAVGQQPTSPTGGFGNAGGAWSTTAGHAAGGGGGAGAKAPNSNDSGISATTGGSGGAGMELDFTGTSTWYAGGGGGGAAQSNPIGIGGSGIGGNGANDNTAATAGATNTGSGGGGGNNNLVAAAGGSGVVHVRYAGNDSPAAAGGDSSGLISGTPYRLHSYTTTGGSTFTPFSGYDPLTQHATISGNLSGSGGLNVDGPGTLVLSGTNNSYEGATTVSSGNLVVDGTHTGAGAFTVADGAAIGGNGSIASSLTLNEGANFWWDGVSKLDVAGTGTVSILGDETFGVDSLVGFDWADIALGNYILIDNNSNFAAMSLNHWGFENRLNVGVDKYAYFSQGSLQLNVVPEPSALGLLGIGLLTMYGLRRRRSA